MILENILLITTGILTSLLAGLFYGYAVSVNLGLGQLKDSEYLTAMQSINRAILNPLFFLVFLGPMFLLPITTFIFEGTASSKWLLLGASVIYIIGVFGITVVGNVPLNDKLAKIDLGRSSDKEITEMRFRYEKPWNRLHVFRTLAAIFATGLVFIAYLVK